MKRFDLFTQIPERTYTKLHNDPKRSKRRAKLTQNEPNRPKTSQNNPRGDLN